MLRQHIVVIHKDEVITGCLFHRRVRILGNLQRFLIFHHADARLLSCHARQHCF